MIHGHMVVDIDNHIGELEVNTILTNVVIIQALLQYFS
jgi:hypothetical protein